jgi:hypothetical protein
MISECILFDLAFIFDLRGSLIIVIIIIYSSNGVETFVDPFRPHPSSYMSKAFPRFLDSCSHIF